MHIVVIVKKHDICMDLDMVNAKKENFKLQFITNFNGTGINLGFTDTYSKS